MTGSIEPFLASALILGFVGSAHCLGMCGGIAAALGQALPAASTAKGLLRSGVYSIGRVTSYSIAGLGIGLFGEAFAVWTGFSTGLRVLAGLLILVFGLHVAGWWNGLAAVERLGLVAWRRLAPLGRRIGRPDRIWKTFLLGMVWGWLPCGLVYAALMGAAATGDAISSAAFMACFGLGTMPALLVASGFGERLNRFLAMRSARRAAGVALLVFGFWSIAGALMPMHHTGMHHGAVDHGAMDHRTMHGGATPEGAPSGSGAHGESMPTGVAGAEPDARAHAGHSGHR